jgi:hypothetical protein
LHLSHGRGDEVATSETVKGIGSRYLHRLVLYIEQTSLYNVKKKSKILISKKIKN